MCLCCPPALRDVFHTPMARYSLFVLKVLLNTNNFRPISLPATCCKVMERVFNSQLLCYLLKHELITKHQHGFIKRKSVSTNLLECLDDWTLNLGGKYITDAIYFDFKKQLIRSVIVNY